MKALLAGFVLFFAASASLAADTNWYIGGSGGQASHGNACSSFEILGLSETCDDDSVGYKVMLGKKIYKYTFLELQVTDAGEARLSTSGGNDVLEINPRMASLFLKFEIPIAVEDRLGVFFKFGGNYYDTDYKRTGIYLGVAESDDGLDTAVGGGFSWRGWDRFSAIFEWENFNDPVVGNGDVTFTSIGVLFHF